MRNYTYLLKEYTKDFDEKLLEGNKEIKELKEK